MMAGILTYPILRQPSHPDRSGQWQWIAVILTFPGRGLQQRALSGIFTRFPIIPSFSDKKRSAVTGANILRYNNAHAAMKKKYSPRYERNFYKFIPSKV